MTQALRFVLGVSVLTFAGQLMADAYSDCLAAAEKGNPEAQREIADGYIRGDRVEQSFVEAMKWYRKSAEQGNARAQYNLSIGYHSGKGVPQSDTEAVLWLQKSADQGYAMAQNRLGDCYAIGDGVERSSTQAVKWYRKSAEQGYADAQYNIGMCYLQGKGVEESVHEALPWLRKAAKQGNETAIRVVKDFDDAIRKKSDKMAEKGKWPGLLLILLLLGGIGCTLYYIVHWPYTYWCRHWGKPRYVCTKCGATMCRPKKVTGMRWWMTLGLLALFVGSLYLAQTVSFSGLGGALAFLVLVLDAVVYYRTMKKRCCPHCGGFECVVRMGKEPQNKCEFGMKNMIRSQGNE